MARLVVLSEGFTGLAYDLKADKTTLGRLEDNMFPIAEASISGHHCELIRKGNEFFVRDLNSTNGTYIDGEQVTESALKPGHILRLGQVEVRLEAGAGAAGVPKKNLDKTMVISQGGVTAHELDPGERPAVSTSTAFSKKTNRVNTIFLAIGIALGAIIVVILLFIFQRAG